MATEIGIGTEIGTEIAIGTLEAQTAIPTTIGTLTMTDTLADRTGTLTTATQHPTTPTDTLQIDTRTTDIHLELDLSGTHLKDIPSIATPPTDTRQESDTLKLQIGIHQPSTDIHPE